MSLKDINLTEDQQKELKEKLDSWMIAEKKKIEEDLTERYEQMEAELKEEYEELVEEIKENMKKVYTKRFTNALKEMYEEIRAEVMLESVNSPENKALEEVKAVVYPLINESTAKRHRDEFEKLAAMYESNLEELELLKGANKKAQLLESLSPDVRKVVNKLLGEGTEEEIVEKFSAIKKALKEEVSTEDQDEIIETSNTHDEEEELIVESDIEDDEEEEIEEDSEKDLEFEKILNEQLILAGIKNKK